MPATATETNMVSSILMQDERRATPRYRVNRPVLACPFGPEYKEEVHTISNTSRDGIYFETRSQHYRVGMPISVSAPYTSPHRSDSPSFGKVVRIDRLADGTLGIAVHILLR
jgi:hypothetical protein